MATSNLWGWGNNDYSNLATYRSASGQDAHSLVANPLLTNRAAYDFTLQAGSPAIGAGIGPSADPLVPTTDINGVARTGATTDIGAYQYSGTVTPPDTTPPTVAITSPAAGASVSGSSVALAATASDNVGVARVEFRVDGALIASDASAPYAATWNAASASAGGHTILATAYDAAGNSTNSSVIVTVPAAAGDTTPPTVALTSPAAGATVSGSSVALAATASDNVGVARVEFQVDGALIASDASAPYAATWNAASASAGQPHDPGHRLRRRGQLHQLKRHRHRPAAAGDTTPPDRHIHAAGRRRDRLGVGRTRWPRPLTTSGSPRSSSRSTAPCSEWTRPLPTDGCGTRPR